MPLFIIVDGLIAAGKTSLLEAINANIDDACVIYEPVDVWKETGNLERFYNALKIKDVENRSAQIYRFQTYVFQTRIKRILQQLKLHPNKKYYFIERSIFSDRYIFMEMLYESGMVTEQDYEMYKDWWELWSHVLPFEPSAFIYLNPHVDECMNRYRSRNRDGEEVDIEYQRQLQCKHDQFFRNNDCVSRLELSTNVDFRSGGGQTQVINEIEKFLIPLNTTQTIFD